MKTYDVTLMLDDVNLPYETALIEGLINNQTLGNFLYTVANDVIEERYNLDAGHNQIILNQLIATVGSIFDTVSSMDTNISDITGSLNTHASVLETLEKLTPILNGNHTHGFINGNGNGAVLTPDLVEVEDLELELEVSTRPAVELEHDRGGNEGLELTDEFEDLFDLDIDS